MVDYGIAEKVSEKVSEKIIDKMLRYSNKWNEVIDASFLTEELKASYKSFVAMRIKRMKN